MGSTLLRLLIVLLGFSYLISLNAAPITRTRNLMIQPQVRRVSENTHLGNTEESRKGERVVRRVELELNDYPGPGANNHHTPTTPTPKTGS